MLAVGLVLACLALGYSFLAPAPPRTLRIAVGPSLDSAYNLAAEAYALRLERVGFRIERRRTAGSVENLALLRAGRIDLALVQGGVAEEERDAGLESLGSVFLEPVWVFLREDSGITRTGGLRGKRIAVGPEGSGTRAMATALLNANEIDLSQVTALPMTGEEAARAMLAGEADAAILVAARPTAAIERLMRAPGVLLLDFAARADAYGVQMPYVTSVLLPRGGISLADDIPPDRLTLIAPVASVVVHETLHPQIVSLMVGIMQEVHRGRSLFAPAGRFPNSESHDLPLNSDARRYYERGATLLQSWLPFWVAVSVERLWVLLLPVLGIALPLLRLGPVFYNWHWETKIWRHYDALRTIEAELSAASTEIERQRAFEALGDLHRRLTGLSVPAAYRRHIFALRRDVAYVRAYPDARRSDIDETSTRAPMVEL